MFGRGVQEMLLSMILVFVVSGAGKLPWIGSSLGERFRNFKLGVRETEKTSQLDELS